MDVFARFGSGGDGGHAWMLESDDRHEECIDITAWEHVYVDTQS